MIQILFAKPIDSHMTAMVIRIDDSYLGGVGYLESMEYEVDPGMRRCETYGGPMDIHVDPPRADIRLRVVWHWWRYADNWKDFVRDAEAHGWKQPAALDRAQRLLK